jgi:hypothetical protein
MRTILKGLRRRHLLVVLVAFLGGSILIATTFGLLLGIDESSEVRLTEEETLGVVLFANHGPAWHLYPHANPTAKPRLYQLLNSHELDRFHGNAYRVLGYIGDEVDVDRIQQALTETYRDLGGFRMKSVFGAFDGLAVLARREVPGAREVLIEMRQPAYWKDRPRWFNADSLDDQLQIAFYISGAIATHQEYDGQIVSVDE